MMKWFKIAEVWFGAIAGIHREFNIYRLVEFSCFGGDDNNAIGGSCSPNAGCGSIFQHGNAFYHIRIDIADVSFIRKIIYHN